MLWAWANVRICEGVRGEITPRYSTRPLSISTATPYGFLCGRMGNKKGRAMG